MRRYGIQGNKMKIDTGTIHDLENEGIFDLLKK